MAEIGATYETLSDIKKKLNPNGEPAQLINLLEQTNEMLADMPWMPTNDATTHRTSVITSLPTPTERQYNEGGSNDKETAAQFVEGTTNLEIWSEVDAQEVENETNPQMFRFQKAQVFLEAMNQAFQNRILYGNNGTNPKQINGFCTRYNSTTATNGQNVIVGGGAQSDNTSLLLIGWGPNKVMGLYPKNTVAGLRHIDKGLVTKDHVGGTTDAKMDVYRDLYRWQFGVHIADWRYVVRIPNIDVSSLRAGSGADLTELMIQAEACIPYPGTARLVWYVPRMVFPWLRIQRRNDVISGGGLTFENVEGKRVAMFGETPVRMVDGFSLAESLVS